MNLIWAYTGCDVRYGRTIKTLLSGWSLRFSSSSPSFVRRRDDAPNRRQRSRPNNSDPLAGCPSETDIESDAIQRRCPPKRRRELPQNPSRRTQQTSTNNMGSHHPQHLHGWRPGYLDSGARVSWQNTKTSGRIGLPVSCSYGTPFLLGLGLSEHVTSLVWLAGPISGLIAQPVIGKQAFTSWKQVSSY